MKRVSAFFARKVAKPLLDQLQQGASPVKLAWSVSLGGAMGLFPVWGSTTLICAAICSIFRLNHVAAQTINYLAYGLQIPLIPVFIRLGEGISGAPPIAIDLVVMKAKFFESPAIFFQDFGMAAWHGVLAWLIVMPIPTWLTARILTRTFQNLSRKTSSQSSPNNR